MSCSTEDASLVADDFHKHLDAGDYDYICNNLVDSEADSTFPDVFRNFLEVVGGWGPQTNRVKEPSFNKQYKNGLSTVKLAYSFDVDGIHMHERIVLVSRADGYKIILCNMNQNEQTVIDASEHY
jgi:hypothetical protein